MRKYENNTNIKYSTMWQNLIFCLKYKEFGFVSTDIFILGISLLECAGVFCYWIKQYSRSSYFKHLTKKKKKSSAFSHRKLLHTFFRYVGRTSKTKLFIQFLLYLTKRFFFSCRCFLILDIYSVNCSNCSCY